MTGHPQRSSPVASESIECRQEERDAPPKLSKKSSKVRRKKSKRRNGSKSKSPRRSMSFTAKPPSDGTVEAPKAVAAPRRIKSFTPFPIAPNSPQRTRSTDDDEHILSSPRYSSGTSAFRSPRKHHSFMVMPSDNGEFIASPAPRSIHSHQSAEIISEEFDAPPLLERVDNKFNRSQRKISPKPNSMKDAAWDATSDDGVEESKDKLVASIQTKGDRITENILEDTQQHSLTPRKSLDKLRMAMFNSSKQPEAYKRTSPHRKISKAKVIPPQTTVNLGSASAFNSALPPRSPRAQKLPSSRSQQSRLPAKNSSGRHMRRVSSMTKKGQHPRKTLNGIDENTEITNTSAETEAPLRRMKSLHSRRRPIHPALRSPNKIKSDIGDEEDHPNSPGREDENDIESIEEPEPKRSASLVSMSRQSPDKDSSSDRGDNVESRPVRRVKSLHSSSYGNKGVKNGLKSESRTKKNQLRQAFKETLQLVGIWKKKSKRNEKKSADSQSVTSTLNSSAHTILSPAADQKRVKKLDPNAKASISDVKDRSVKDESQDSGKGKRHHINAEQLEKYWNDAFEKNVSRKESLTKEKRKSSWLGLKKT